MTISHNWLNSYLPEPVAAEKCATILTSIGLEVEKTVSQGFPADKLAGLVVGKVIACEKHPNADALKITAVDIAAGDPLQIVCGAPNVALGQKVVVATVGAELHPLNGDPFRIKKAKIRGEESMGMLCASDEIGLSDDHEGILILPEHAITGDFVGDYLNQDPDVIFEIGLTPNRTDAMSHYGVARDICAYISHHENRPFAPVFPETSIDPEGRAPITVSIENNGACMRYSGLYIEGIRVSESPEWLKKRLTAIGLKPLNNIVDITNYVLHETGQPLHAFDADMIKGKKVIVKTLPQGTPFITLDGKERTLQGEDLMICDTEKPLCIAGVYGGINSGVSQDTKNIFLESACFSPEYIRKTSLHHGLRTDAATRFEKGADISRTVAVLSHAAKMILEIAGGRIEGSIEDIYPVKKEKKQISLSWKYIGTLSGKMYPEETIKKILLNLQYEIVRIEPGGITVSVPFHKPAVNLAADLVQEVMRIDGLDNIQIPSGIYITPAIEKNKTAHKLKQKAANALTYSGFSEIFTNSLVNSNWFDETQLTTAVKMINSLSAELDTMRPSMLPGTLQAMAYNINRRNNNLAFYEFGKIYSRTSDGFHEEMHLAVSVSGARTPADWKHPGQATDLFHLKGVLNNLFAQLGIPVSFKSDIHPNLSACLHVYSGKQVIAVAGEVNSESRKKHDIKAPVYYADINWEKLEQVGRVQVKYTGIPKFPSAERDLALIVDKSVAYADIETATTRAGLPKLASMKLFDVFENEKLGEGKKSMAISYTFIDEIQTLTDEEMDSMVQKLIGIYEKELKAIIRKQ